nr:hypothetical protein [Parafrankia soli]
MNAGDGAAGAESRTSAEPEVLVVADAAAWRAWLDVNEAVSDGV